MNIGKKCLTKREKSVRAEKGLREKEKRIQEIGDPGNTGTGGRQNKNMSTGEFRKMIGSWLQMKTIDY